MHNEAILKRHTLKKTILVLGHCAHRVAISKIEHVAYDGKLLHFKEAPPIVAHNYVKAIQFKGMSHNWCIGQRGWYLRQKITYLLVALSARRSNKRN